jgi:DNA repair exonuclease SbcCD nuclease subunit
MSKPFNRALVFTDIHFGKKSNSQQFNQDCLDFVDWATKLGQEKKCDRVIFCGDWHHNRASISLYTLTASLRALELINERFDRADFIVGNHDLYYRDKRTIASMEWANHISNIHIHNDIYREGDMVMIPWLVQDEYRTMRKLNAKHVFGHFELPKFKMNAMIEMPDHGEIQAEDLEGIEYVWTGHFHKRQSRKNINYIGNAFPHDYSDAWDDERGAMILEWDGNHDYYAWNRAPKYRVIKLSQLLDNPDYHLTKESYLRVNIDIPISYEEANFIRETFDQQYNPRELALIPQKQDESVLDNIQEVKFESVDQIVHTQLSNVESDFYDTKILLQIYENL